MASIQLKRSITPGAVPTSAQLGAGELAVNVADGRFFMKNASGEVLQMQAFPTTWAGLNGTYGLDFVSLDAGPPTALIIFTTPASVGFDFGAMP